MIRKATLDDIDTLMSLFEHSRRMMRANGNATQWVNGYPDRDLIADDIQKSTSHIVERDGEVAGTFVLAKGADPTYASIEHGHWIDAATPYGTMHRMACAPGWHNIAHESIVWSEGQADSLRADTHSDNTIVRHILERHNFIYCGIIHVADGTPRMAYQKMPYTSVPATLRQYVETEILPRYDAFDEGHSRQHVLRVIANSMLLARHYDTDPAMVYAIAAYHDTGIVAGRERHHIVSRQIISNDQRLRQWFTPEQTAIMAEAAEDHRASSGQAPRSIYGMIVAEADRDIEPEQIVIRSIQYGQRNYPTLDHEGLWQRTRQHLHEKYAEGGYLRLWLPESPNRERLQELRVLLADEDALREIYEHETEQNDR